MLPDVAKAVRLQEIDQQTDALQKEVSALPKHIAEIEKKLDSHQRRLEADRSALAGNQKERKRLDGEIQIQQQKISKLRDQMLGAKTNDQYRAFQNEITFCETEIRKFEDRILDLMGESETLEKAVKTAEEALKVERSQVETEKEQARERTAIDLEKMAVLGKTRAELTGDMSPKVLALYQRLRKARGVAVAEVVDGRCRVCHITVRLQYLQDLKDDREVMTCESCGRILFYNPPVQVEDIAGAAAQP
jgi:uncharacterized protein